MSTFNLLFAVFNFLQRDEIHKQQETKSTLTVVPILIRNTEACSVLSMGTILPEVTLGNLNWLLKARCKIALFYFISFYYNILVFFLKLL